MSRVATALARRVPVEIMAEAVIAVAATSAAAKAGAVVLAMVGKVLLHNTTDLADTTGNNKTTSDFLSAGQL